MEFNEVIETNQEKLKFSQIRPETLKESTRVVGYFSYTEAGDVFCDGDACIIAGSEESMKAYLKELSVPGVKKDILRKTRFGEIISGMAQGGLYAFDQESHARLVTLFKANGIECFAPEESFLDPAGKKCFVKFGISGN